MSGSFEWVESLQMGTLLPTFRATYKKTLLPLLESLSRNSDIPALLTSSEPALDADDLTQWFRILNRHPDLGAELLECSSSMPNGDTLESFAKDLAKRTRLVIYVPSIKNSSWSTSKRSGVKGLSPGVLNRHLRGYNYFGFYSSGFDSLLSQVGQMKGAVRNDSTDEEKQAWNEVTETITDIQAISQSQYNVKYSGDICSMYENPENLIVMILKMNPEIINCARSVQKEWISREWIEVLHGVLFPQTRRKKKLSKRTWVLRELTDLTTPWADSSSDVVLYERYMSRLLVSGGSFSEINLENTKFTSGIQFNGNLDDFFNELIRYVSTSTDDDSDFVTRQLEAEADLYTLADQFYEEKHVNYDLVKTRLIQMLDDVVATLN